LHQVTVQIDKRAVVSGLIPIKLAPFKRFRAVRNGQDCLRFSRRSRWKLCEKFESTFPHCFFEFFVSDISEIAKGRSCTEFLALKK
jgi:hypothetical protein